MSTLLFAIIISLGFIAWAIDRRRVTAKTMEEAFNHGYLSGRIDGSRTGYKNGYDTAVVDCQIQRGQRERARHGNDGKFKGIKKS